MAAHQRNLPLVDRLPPWLLLGLSVTIGASALGVGIYIGARVSAPTAAERLACLEAASTVMSTRDQVELERAKFLVEQIRGCRNGAEAFNMSEAADELFLMTNLYPASTGLPMVVWVGPSSGAPHDARIKVMQVHGTRPLTSAQGDPSNRAVGAVRPVPRITAGQLSSADFQAVVRWIALNERAIIDHWNGLTDGVQLGQQLRRIPWKGQHSGHTDPALGH